MIYFTFHILQFTFMDNSCNFLKMENGKWKMENTILQGVVCG